MNNNKGFLINLYNSFKRTNGYALSFLSFLITLSIYYFSPDSKIAIKHIVVLLSLFIILGITLVDAYIIQLNSMSKILPKAVSGSVPPKIVNDSIALILTDASPLLGHEIVVSIFKNKDSYEILIGVGYVFNIQENGKIQILVTSSYVDNDGTWEQIRNNDANAISKLIIKPGARISF